MTVSVATTSIIEGLLREGHVAAHGDFTLDMVKAREKLRHFQLLSPHLFVLELIGAAVSGHATSIDVTTEIGRIRVVMQEVQPYSKTELAQLHANLFLSQEDPRLDRLRQLAIGLNSGLALLPRSIELHSQHPRGLVYVKLTPTSESRGQTSASDGTVRTAVTMNDAPGLTGFRRLLPHFDEEIALIHGRCRHADIPIRVNGQAINKPVRLEPCMAQVTCERGGVQATLALASSLPVGLRPYLEEKDRYGMVFWYTGHPFGAPLDDSVVIFMLNGVMLAEKRVALVPGMGVKALCSAQGLLKNASQSDIHENGRYQQVLGVMRNMVPVLMAELQQTVKHIEAVLADPHQWPHEGSGNFRRYLAGELELGRSYLKHWGEIAWEAEAETSSLETPVIAAPRLEKSPEWLAYTDIESPSGHGWMALPSAGRPSGGFAIEWEGRPVEMRMSFTPTRLCGRLQLAVDLRDASLAPDRAQVLSALATGVEQLLSDVAADFPSLPPASQPLARADILEYLLADQRKARDFQKAPPFSFLGRLQQAPIFHSTDGASLNLQDLLDLFARHGTLHFTSQPVSGRSLDPSLRVVRLSPEEVHMLSDLFKFTEYSRDLEDEEKARQLQRERGMVQPRLDPSGVLAHTRWKLDNAELCLALPRPYRGVSVIQYYKRGVLIEEGPLGELPCTGFVLSNSLEVDAEWQHVTLGDHQRESLENTLLQLYQSIAAALEHLDPTHPDYATCCRYVLDRWQTQRESLLACGGPQVDPTIFTTRHGRRLGLSAVIRRFRERGRVELIEAGDLQLVVPDGVIVLTPDRPWIRDFLMAFFGETHVHEWQPRDTLAATAVKVPTLVEGPIEQVVQALFQQLGLPVRVVVNQHPTGWFAWLRPSGGPEDPFFNMPDSIGYWEGGETLYLNMHHRLVRDVERRGRRDRARFLHLMLALVMARNPDPEGEAVLQLRVVQAVLAGLC